jgi:site-specific DNA-cytosine methylase
MLRLIREIKPEFVIGENVQGIINLQDGMVLRQVQDQLESEGFEVQCFLIPASGIGAWHQRYRVWIVGHSQHNGLLAAEKRCRDEKDYGGSQKRENETIEPTRASGSRNNENVSNTDTRLSIGENQEIQTRRDSITSSSKDVSNTNSGLRRRGTTIGESRENKVWGFYSEKEKQTRVDIRSKAVGRNVVPGGKTWWQTQSNIYGVPNGISYELDKDRANRIKALGNAIVPQIARELGLAIKKVINEDTYI